MKQEAPKKGRVPAMPEAEPVHWTRCGVDVMDAIYERRAVRDYTARKVEKGTVQALIDAAIQAPSAVNQQPWAFVVIQDAGLLQHLSERGKQLSLAELKPDTPLWDHRAMLEDPAFSIFYCGGTLIVVCAAPGLWPTNEDCCLAAQNLMLAAHGLGLGTCPIGLAREALNEPETKRALGIPADHSAVLPILVGYPRQRPARTPRRRADILAWK
jgi:nitroreductase